MATVGVVDDDRDVCAVVRRALERDGHSVHSAFTGRGAIALVEQQRPEVLLLDWMLPDMEGLIVCRTVHARWPDVSIIMVTARAEEVDAVRALDLGVDDYMRKPIRIHELQARIRTQIRRRTADAIASLAQQSPDASTELADPILIDAASRTVRVHGTPVVLTRKEFDLLAFLVANPNRVFNRDVLLERIWGYETESGEHTITTHIERLRAKLGEQGKRIHTVWGSGYSLDPVAIVSG